MKIIYRYEDKIQKVLDGIDAAMDAFTTMFQEKYKYFNIDHPETIGREKDRKEFEQLVALKARILKYAIPKVIIVKDDDDERLFEMKGE